MVSIIDKLLVFLKFYSHTPKQEQPKEDFTQFKLFLKQHLIGILEYQNSLWTFYYSEEFKQQTIIHPILNFPDIDKVYTSKSLSSFFVIRIPSPNRIKAQRLLKKGEPADEVSLLKKFGMYSVANPYKLVFVQ